MKNKITVNINSEKFLRETCFGSWILYLYRVRLIWAYQEKAFARISY